MRTMTKCVCGGTRHSHDSSKVEGAGLMVSDFVEESNGYLRLSREEYDDLEEDEKPSNREAREILQYGAER